MPREERVTSLKKSPVVIPGTALNPKLVIKHGIRSVGMLFCAFALLAGLLDTPITTAFADVRDTDAINGIQLSEFTGSHDAPDIQADYAGICSKDGSLLWERDADIQVPMASITKIMTALVALDSAELDTPITVSNIAAELGGSTAELQAGEIVDLHTLLYGLLIPSGNDAATAIAEGIAGNEAAFVEKMNQKAAELGLRSTAFSNVSGIEDVDNYTTVSDCLQLTRIAMTDQVFRQIVGVPEATVTIDGVDVTYESTNLLFEEFEGAIGVKTGFTDAAGYCLVASAQRNGIELYSVVLNCDSDVSRVSDSVALLEWGFQHYRPIELVNSAKPVGQMALKDWLDKTVEVHAANPVSVQLFDYDGDVSQEVSLNDWEGSVAKGESVGSIVWAQNGEVVATTELVSAESVAAPDFFQWLNITWSRFWGGFSGSQTVASTKVYLGESFQIPAPVAG